MGLPLGPGDEVPHEPHVAATARPWPGAVALFSSTRDAGYGLQDVIRDRSIVGVTEAPLLRGPTGIWDRQGGFVVKLVSGTLAGQESEEVFAGANTMAIGDGTPDNWEVFQFAQAEPIGDRRYALTDLLRGQAGTSGMIPDSWPTGSVVVLMDGKPGQIAIPSASRGNLRHFRYGPVKAPVSSPSYRHRALAFQGNGYRPFPVVHLRGQVAGNGDLALNWIRQTRIDGDRWTSQEVPLGEETERYLVQVRQGGAVLREVERSVPFWTYAAGDQTSDAAGPGFTVAVAQISARFGPGPFRRMSV